MASELKRVPRERKITTFSRSIEPVMEVETGEKLTFETNNGSLIATGPVSVKGAEPGDALAVRIGEMRFGDVAEMRMRPGKGVFGDYLAEKYDTVQRPSFPIVNNRVVFNDRIQIPPQLMVGLIGTTPSNQEIPTSWPGRHGGNLDNKLVAPGSHPLPARLRRGSERSRWRPSLRHGRWRGDADCDGGNRRG